jgi:hypothetical protein
MTKNPSRRTALHGFQHAAHHRSRRLQDFQFLGAGDRHEVFRSVLSGLLRGRSRPKEKQQDEAAHVERRALLKAEAHETED